jgi:hypothetical protein
MNGIRAVSFAMLRPVNSYVPVKEPRTPAQGALRGRDKAGGRSRRYHLRDADSSLFLDLHDRVPGAES